LCSIMKNFDTNTIVKFDISKSVAIFGDRVYSILNYQNPFNRSNKLGHITASGLVIRDDKVLLILHPYLQSWFQPGGHIDDGESPIDAAIREVREEMRQVSWPTRPEVINYTSIVLFVLVLMTSLIFGLGFGFSKFVTFLFTK